MCRRSWVRLRRCHSLPPSSATLRSLLAHSTLMVPSAFQWRSSALRLSFLSPGASWILPTAVVACATRGTCTASLSPPASNHSLHSADAADAMALGNSRRKRRAPIF